MKNGIISLYNEDSIHNQWSNVLPVFYRGKKYSVHKMSYGQYFLQPYNKKNLILGEKEDFAKGTVWLKKNKSGLLEEE